MKKTALICALAIGFGMTAVTLVTISDAWADEGSAVVDAGPPTGPGSGTAPSLSDKLHNPVDDPLAAISDLRAAKKQGWAAAILAAIVMLTAGLARAAQRWPTVSFLAWFGKHKTAIFIVGGVGTVSAAAYNTLVLGGTVMAVIFAAVGAVLTLIAPTPKAPS